jgi:hypothetical protein
MFSSKGFFSEVICPYSQSCLLPRCIFKHPTGKLNKGNSTANTNDELEPDADQDGQRKRQKVSDEKEEVKMPDSQPNIDLPAKTPTKLSAAKPILDEKPSKRGLASTRSISPPPLRRKTENGSDHVGVKLSRLSGQTASATSTPRSAAKAPAKTLAKAPVKEEGLNPRALKIPAPASHDMRFRLLRALHEQFVRLNSEVARDATDDEEALVLSEQALIKKALDLEEDAAATPAIYSNLVKNKILVYKRMTVKQWIEERAKEVSIANAKAKGLSKPIIKPSEPPKPIETGLTNKQELSLLSRIYTPVSHLSSHGYVTSIPTDQEIASAKSGIEAAKGWEVCDRCKTRFQVFPGRRESDGALASGGKCTYHYGKPYFPERSVADPKAKREKKYRCCGEAVGDSSGCTQAEHHVFKISEAKRLATILNFEITPNNPSKECGNPVCIDGEMGYTVYGLELIRLTATSWPSGESLFDVLVKPIGLVLDLNSRYSGVWPKHFANALPHVVESHAPGTPPPPSDPPPPLSSTPPPPLPNTDTFPAPNPNTPLRIVSSPADARALLFTHLSPSTPLIGHGLENDLNAVRIIHPTIIDTALLFPHRAGLPFRNGLKALMSQYLGRQIQVVVEGEGGGHDSKEDANAAGDLVRWKIGEEWKRMRREGWTAEGDGEFVAPGKKGETGNGSGSEKKVLVAGGGEKRKGKKRSQDEMAGESDAEMDIAING